MIDFRYHLVSLISVFLALAVGIILGAGPLQNAIGDQLQDQVETLRVERNDLRENLQQTESELADQQAFSMAAGAELIDGSLEGVRVAVVDVDGMQDALELEVVTQLEDAGARVVAQAALTSAFTDLEEITLRGTVADGQRGALSDVIDGDADTATTLGAVLAVALTEESEDEDGERSGRAVELYQLLDRVGFIEARFAPSAPADAILLLSAGTDAEATEGEEVDGGEVVGSVTGVADVAGAVVLAGTTTDGTDLVGLVRSAAPLNEQVSTVSGVEDDVMRLNVPLALAAQYTGVVAHYGFEPDASVLAPSVALPEEPETDALGPTSGLFDGDDADAEATTDADDAGGSDGADDEEE